MSRATVATSHQIAEILSRPFGTFWNAQDKTTEQRVAPTHLRAPRANCLSRREAVELSALHRINRIERGRAGLELQLLLLLQEGAVTAGAGGEGLLVQIRRSLVRKRICSAGMMRFPGDLGSTQRSCLASVTCCQERKHYRIWKAVIAY
jgi:hypothetical protein